MESIGFSGTTSIASILNESFDDIYVIHGSRNAISRERIGINNQTPSDFINSMKKIEEATNKKVIALHCTYLPSKIIPVCQRAHIDFKMLVRDPQSQIMSCFSWAVKKILTGDMDILCQIKAIQNEISKYFQDNDIENSFENRIYFWSAKRVIAFNADAANIYSEFCKMEDVLQTGQGFSNAFNLSELPRKNLQNKKILNSHKEFFERFKSRGIKMNTPDVCKILPGLVFHFKSRIINIKNLSVQMGYDEPLFGFGNSKAIDFYTENYFF